MTLDWDSVIDAACDWADRLGPVRDHFRPVAGKVLTATVTGLYADPEAGRLGVHAQDDRDRDALADAVVLSGTPAPLLHKLATADLLDAGSRWVKVAYSPLLKRTGEVLNFFPSSPGGLPNAPSPFAATLTTGLLGAGLGWGAGKLLQRLAPESYGRRIARTGAILGGLMGAAPGATWGALNLAAGKGLLDPHPFRPTTPIPALTPQELPAGQGGALRELRDRFDPERNVHGKVAAGAPDPPGPFDVQVSALGRVLWDADPADRADAARVGATVWAAGQMPTEEDKPGFVTGHQLGTLARRAGGDYFRGYVSGLAINGIVGTPIPASTYGKTSVAIGLLGSLVPVLLGR